MDGLAKSAASAAFSQNLPEGFCEGVSLTHCFVTATVMLLTLFIHSLTLLTTAVLPLLTVEPALNGVFTNSKQQANQTNKESQFEMSLE